MPHEAFIEAAIAEALASKADGGQPFGAVLVKDGEVVARGRNRVNQDGDPTSHAELNLLRDFCASQRQADLRGYAVYASFEPCAMCAAAIAWAGVSLVAYGADAADLPSAYPRRANPLSCAEVLKRFGSEAVVAPHVLRAQAAAVFGDG